MTVKIAGVVVFCTNFLVTKVTLRAANVQ